MNVSRGCSPAPYFFLFLLLQVHSCTISTTSPSQVKLLQQNGSTQYFTTFAVCPNTPLTTSTIPTITSSSSSSQQVLPLDSITLNTVISTPCRNLTALFTFDALVGQTTYTLNAATDSDACTSSISFIVVGFTIYDTVSSSSVTSRTIVPADSRAGFVHIILSGHSNNIRTDYRENLQTPTKAFSVRVQFPDGTDSTTRSVPFLLDSLSTLTATSDTNAASPVQLDQRACEIVSDDLEDSLKDPLCGAAFAQHDQKLEFAMRYKPYRDGLNTLLFDWNFLTADDPDLADESYQNFLAVEVVGNPPPIITSIEPKKSFYRAGGEQITVVFDNVDDSSDRTLRVGAFEFPEVPGSFRKLRNGLYEAKFLTKPGRGTDLHWTVDVAKTSGEVSESELVDDAEDETISFIDIPLSIDRIEPPFAVEGQTVILTGYFDHFDPSRPEHEILIGNKPLSELGIIPKVTENSISFFIPSRSDVGAAYEFPITVVMNEEETGNDEFAYVPEQPIELTIEVYGTSYNNEIKEYSLGQCDFTDYEANLPSGVSDPDEFRWEMYQLDDPALLNLLTLFPEIPSNERQLRLPPKAFGDRTGAFEVFVACTVQNVTLNATVTVVKTEAPVIGVTLSRSRKRTISTPSVPVRIDALVFPPDSDCFSFAENQEIIFEWSYREKTYVYPPSDPSQILQLDSPRPSRLGREFIIPQLALRYGNLSVSLFTYVDGARSVQGTSLVTVSVVPSDMVPVIGFGASTVMQSSTRSLEITGERSFNPDEIVRTDIGVEIFQWGCRVSTTSENFEPGEPCGPDLLPSNSERAFMVTTETLQRVRNQLLNNTDDSGIFYLQYSLSVGSVFGMSDPAFQVVAVLPFDKDVASLDSVSIYNNKGNLLDWRRIPVSEDVTIVPEGIGVTWAYDIVFPPSAMRIFNDSENLITVPEYFDPNFPIPLTSALGIRAGALLAAQEYEISITLFGAEASLIPGEVRIRIRTLDLPKLALPKLPLSSGDLKTTFSATARVNLDNTYVFAYSFYLISAEGEEYCLGGCSGRSTVHFRVVQAGTYRILVRLRDMQGAALLDEQFFSNRLTVTDSSSRPSVDLSSLPSLLMEAYRTRDHGTVELLAAYLPRITRSRGASSFSASELDSVRRLLGIMYEVVRNSSPTTMLSKSYTKTASRLASVISDYFSSEETMYVLFSMVHTALLRVPPAESLDLENELSEFYNFSARHVFRAFAGSSSRSLRQPVTVPEFERGARALLIDMFLLQQEHLSIAMSRDAYCGAVRHADTIVQGGVPAREIGDLVRDAWRLRARKKAQEHYDFVGNYNQPSLPSFSSFTVGILCTPRQASGIRGDVSNFTWCEDAGEAGFSARAGVYRLDPAKKKLFTLAETMDFVAMSGLAEDDIETDTYFLVTTNLTEVGSQGLRAFFVPEIKGCLEVNTSMIRLGVTGTRGCLSADAFIVNAFGSAFMSREAAETIERNFSGVTSVISRDKSSTIVISSSRPGAFGAVGKDCPINARKPVITPPEQDVEFAYLVFGGAVVAVVGVTVTWVATSFSYAGSAGAAAAAA